MHLPPGFSLAVDLLLGLSMLLMVFDDSRMRTRRLGVLNALTTTITRSQQHGPMTETALGELKTLMGAKAAWFRLLEGDKLVLTTQIGLSPDYVRDRFSVPVDESLKGMLAETVPMVIETSSAADTIRPHLKRERFHHVVMLPVLGKKSVIGTLSLGSRTSLLLHSRRYGVSGHQRASAGTGRREPPAGGADSALPSPVGEHL